MTAHSQTYNQLNTNKTPTTGWRKLVQGNGLIRSTVAVVALGLGGGVAIEKHREANNNHLAISEHLAQASVAAGQQVTIPNIYNNAYVTFETLKDRGGCPTFVVEGESKVRTSKFCTPKND